MEFEKEAIMENKLEELCQFYKKFGMGCFFNFLKNVPSDYEKIQITAKDFGFKHKHGYIDIIVVKTGRGTIHYVKFLPFDCGSVSIEETYLNKKLIKVNVIYGHVTAQWLKEYFDDVPFTVETNKRRTVVRIKNLNEDSLTDTRLFYSLNQLYGT